VAEDVEVRVLNRGQHAPRHDVGVVPEPTVDRSDDDIERREQ